MQLSLKGKVLVPSLGLVFVGLAFLSWANIGLLSSSMKRIQSDDMSVLAQSLSISLSSDIASKQTLLAHWAKDPRIVSAAKAQAAGEATFFLRNRAGSEEGMLYAHLFGAKGTLLATTLAEIASVNVADRDYFMAIMQKGMDHFVSSPLVSRTIGKNVVIISQAVKDGTQSVGVLTMAVDLAHLTSEINLVKIGSSGYAMLLDGSGVIIGHPDPKLLMKNEPMTAGWGPAVLAVKTQDILELPVNGTKELVIVRRDERTGWFLVLVTSNEDLQAMMDKSTRTNLLASLGVTATLFAALWFIVSSVVIAPVRQIESYAKAVAGGDLDVGLPDGRQDELGNLTLHVGGMVQGLKKTIQKAEEATRVANEQTQRASVAASEAEAAKAQALQARREGALEVVSRLGQVVERLSSAATEIDSQIKIIEENAERQEHGVAGTAAAMEQMNASAAEVAHNAGEASNLAEEAKKTAQNGHEVGKQSVAAIEIVNALAAKLQQGMVDLGERAKDVGSIMTVISDIADQTNLLALNAAIEAARAGDAGRGFAVVADEVRKLAEKTMGATKEVGDAIRAIQGVSAENAGRVNEAGEAIAKATALSSSSGQALEHIVSLVDRTNLQVRSIATASKEQSSTAQEIAGAMGEMSRFTAELAMGLKESMSAVEDMSNQSSELESLIMDLRRQEGDDT